jgi:hypothetical protein
VFPGAVARNLVTRLFAFLRLCSSHAACPLSSTRNVCQIQERSQTLEVFAQFK